MKTSNKLLLVLATAILAGLVATGFALKNEYEATKDLPRVQEGFSRVEVPAFLHVKINSLSPEMRVYVQQGRPLVQVNNSLAAKIKTRVQNDTLFVELPERMTFPKTPDNPNGEQIGLSVIVARLGSVTLANGLAGLAGLRADSLFIELHNNSRMNVYRNKVKEMHVAVRDQSVCNLEDSNEIKQLHSVKSGNGQMLVGGISIGSVRAVE